jgi:gas vesicle protein
MNKSAKMVIAFAAGAAAGLVAGLLLAPEKGSDTRKKIVDAGKKVSNSISEMVGACKKEMAANSEG